jgi:hypothetical protein
LLGKIPWHRPCINYRESWFPLCPNRLAQEFRHIFVNLDRHDHDRLLSHLRSAICTYICTFISRFDRPFLRQSIPI